TFPASSLEPASNAHEPLLSVLTDIAKGMTGALQQVQHSLDALAKNAAVRDEDLALLWWLHSKYSKSLNQPFSDVGYRAGVFLFPSEMATLTAFVPGPESAIGVLLQALQAAGAPSTAEPITLAAATNALARPIRERLAPQLKDLPQATLAPALLAIAKSIETDGEEDWFPLYRKLCDAPLDRPFSIAHLSLQLFRELMLLQSLREAN
ncbi:MAG: GTPase-associated system all-helical protein GASH, partial [Vicinamibacterales bacterium]